MRSPRFPRPVRLGGLLLAALGTGAALTACGGTGTDTKCSTSSCTVTFDRGVDAEVSILGLKAELVRVNGQQATVEVGGQSVTLPVGETQQGGDTTVAVKKITEENVVVEFSVGGGG